MKNIAVIMATGTSKRVPMKNIADVCGRPMLSYVVDIAKASGVCDNIVVSTDNPKIRTIADWCNVDVVVRDKEWNNERANIIIAENSVTRYEKNTGFLFDYCFMFFGTAIFWRPSWLREALYIMETYKEIALVRAIHSPECCTGFKIQRNSDNSIYERPLDYSESGYNYNEFPIPHQGINIDIDYPHELSLARQTMQAIQDGHIDYPLEENVHETFESRQHTIKLAEPLLNTNLASNFVARQSISN